MLLTKGGKGERDSLRSQNVTLEPEPKQVSIHDVFYCRIIFIAAYDLLFGSHRQRLPNLRRQIT